MSPPLPPASRRRLAAAAVVLAATTAAAALALPGSLDGLVYLLPALALGLTLALRRYPGERALTALAAGRRLRPLRTPASSPPAVAGTLRALLPRGGALLAACMAERPPPRALSAH
jgi:hypothetical protein